MTDRKFSFGKIPNYIYIAAMLLLFIVVVFFNKNVGFFAFSRQLSKIDTLQMECDQLRQQIVNDSLAIDALSDSSKLDRYLHEKMLFVGEGETMYQIKDTSLKH